ncbi:MAG: ABC transporter substrate-binding protein [Candidatus Eisenbacteria bacterium]|uniref:1,4-dihydroxy-6-naphtoate synthase n=1 Tax=Eiseniibacteriota bacterium TaxID=2212470 RepID=A0A7Y2ECR6_UNCEI|nr:ABC transporter substrate-binding protein [Candidatus Eisenbacteria bacterium]
MNKEVLTLGHSPDPDDAFMHYALAKHKIDMGPYDFEHILQDIETLNQRAMRKELDITAVSIHAYAYIQDKYMLLPHGASMGEGYGPMVVAREEMAVDDLRSRLIAIPGVMTSAFLELKLMIGNFKFTVIPFDQIIQAVVDGKVDAGLIIHEGQLTYQQQGLKEIVNLGKWWEERTGGLPLPLGGNAIRRDLGEEKIATISRLLKESIVYGLEHREEAVEHALQYARDMNMELADEFVGMYVNERTVDYGDSGREAVRRLLDEGFRAGLIPGPVNLQFSV